MAELTSYQADVIDRLARIETNMTNAVNSTVEVKASISTLDHRVTKLEAFMWKVLGGVSVVGFLLGVLQTYAYYKKP